MVITVRNMSGVDAHSSRILASLAASVVYRYNKRVLILQSGRTEPVEDTLAGRKIRDSHILSSETAFEDSGMDALLRRVEMGSLSAKQFSDSCYAMLKADNTFDVAGVSKVQDFDVYLSENMGLFRELLRSGLNVYDVVFVHINSAERGLIKQIEMTCTEFNGENVGTDIPLNVICTLQGYRPSEDISKHMLIVSDFASDSHFTLRYMRHMYDVKNMVSVPHDVSFVDACLREDAIAFLASNAMPEKWEDTFAFADGCAKATGILLGMQEPELEKMAYSYLPPLPKARKLEGLRKKGGSKV